MKKAIRNILQQFGIFGKTFRVEDLDVKYRYSSTNAQESRNAANKKEEPDRKVRQEPLLAQEAAFPDSSELNILEYYRLVNHDPNFTKYFADEVVYKAESVDALKAESRELAKQKRENTNAKNAWLDSESVKQIEEQRKQYGLFSPEAKAFKASAVYQEYLNQREARNAKGKALSQQNHHSGVRVREVVK